MLTYSFSRREKALLVLLAIVVLAIVWFVFVFQRTGNEIASIDARIGQVQDEVIEASAKLTDLERMRAAVEESKQAGARALDVPLYDNTTPLMNELNSILGAANTYNVTFDTLDTATAGDYVMRGVQVTFSSDTYPEAEAILDSFANGKYPCSIDSLTLSDGSAKANARSSSASPGVNATIHATFYEKRSTRTSAP